MRYGRFWTAKPPPCEAGGTGGGADAFTTAYGVTLHGNASTGSAHGFEGKKILEFVGDLDQRPALAGARRKLLETRKKRVHPGRDDV